MSKDRLLAKVTFEPNSGCWLWTASCDQKGYGRIWINDRPMGAHRLSYGIFIGPVPSRLFVCHRCDVRSCVNPDHLFVGTAQDNARDAANKGRTAKNLKHHIENQRGESNASAKLTDQDVTAIINSTDRHAIIAKRFGISKGYVSKIKRRVYR